jgi:hypothetical protein
MQGIIPLQRVYDLTNSKLGKIIQVIIKWCPYTAVEKSDISKITLEIPHLSEL